MFWMPRKPTDLGRQQAVVWRTLLVLHYLWHLPFGGMEHATNSIFFIRDATDVPRVRLLFLRHSCSKRTLFANLKTDTVIKGFEMLLYIARIYSAIITFFENKYFLRKHFRDWEDHFDFEFKLEEDPTYFLTFLSSISLYLLQMIDFNSNRSAQIYYCPGPSSSVTRLFRPQIAKT